ncbi:hypothetical protein GP486_004200 [Trichoglossum hirsutum]|uniref:Uncharacterized protein n=1 Tax=Trichoglossum hirsutum TaxID=265104 RepID=A0A9P8LBJ1_9PEZI|nr:hypothetical protein GP486_004200 [Trichoglossum hirsutum]
MTYGYESISTLSGNVSGINDIATDLLNRLDAKRRSERGQVLWRVKVVVLSAAGTLWNKGTGAAALGLYIHSEVSAPAPPPGTGATAYRQQVDQGSARLNLPSEKVFPVQANHRDMCKFSSLGCQKYEPISAAIEELVAAAENDPRVGFDVAPIEMLACGRHTAKAAGI